MQRPAFLLASALLLSTSGLELPTQAKENRPNIEVPNMMRFCTGEAAEKFSVSPLEISTLPVEQKNNNYRVYGQTPAEGSDALFFFCEFNQHREFDGVIMRIDKRPSPDRGGSAKESVKVQDMGSYCSDMAYEKFKQSPQLVRSHETSDEPIRLGDGTYEVYGQYKVTHTQGYVCTFNPNGVFKGVKEN